MLIWPEKHEDFVTWARALDEIIGGRKDVAAHKYEKYWGPWRGSRVKLDYEAKPGEFVKEYKNKGTGNAEKFLMYPLGVDSLLLHLRGKERLGVYVLDAGNQVKFLAADFDDHEGKLDANAVWGEVKAFVDICSFSGWTTHIERSHSGAGYHVWMFFDSPVDAGKARAIGKWLFEKSKLIDQGTDFSTFDRFFPSQSKVPAGGFGNLIALPCFGFAKVSAGKTAWINIDRETIADQFAYTRKILDGGRNAAARVDAFIAEWDLKPEETEAQNNFSFDENAPLGTSAEFEAMRERCAFINWVPDRRAWPKEWPGASEPLWFAWLSNISRFEDAREWSHQVNSWHPKYNRLDQDFKFDHARRGSAPQSCQRIRDEGFKGCPSGGCPLPGENRIAKAPAGLAGWANVKEFKTGKYSRNVNTKPRELAEEARERIYGGDLPINPETGSPWPPLPEGWGMGEGVVHKGRNGPDLITMRPIWVEAKTRSIYGEPGVLVRFYSHEFRPLRYAFPARRLNETGSTLAVELVDLEFPTVPGKEKWLARYLALQWADTKPSVISTSALGWIKTNDKAPAFVLPEQIIGNPEQEIVYQPENSGTVLISKCLHRKGELAKWQQRVASEVYGHPFLMFALMMGLAGPLVWFCDVETAGFHFYGTSSRGKTTMAQVAASVWGNGEDPQTARGTTAIRTWNATGAALEGTAELYNHICLCLDEIGEVDPFELGKIIYQLAGGISKGRGQAQGGIRAFKMWRLLFLSTGEKSVKQIIASTGATMKGGQRVRLPDIPVDTPDGRSDIVHGDAGEAFVRGLKTSCGQTYGVAGPTFAGVLIGECAVKGVTKVTGELKAELAAIERRLLGYTKELPNELTRVVRRFAVCCLAGMRAAQAGILPGWDLAQVELGVAHVMLRWLEEIGAEVNEVDRAAAHLRDAIIANLSRFHSLESKAHTAQVRDLIGFLGDEYLLFTPRGFAELCGDFDPKLLLNWMRGQGMLWHDAGKLTRKSPRIELLGNSRPYLYWVHKRFLGEEEDDFGGAIVPEDGHPY